MTQEWLRRRVPALSAVLLLHCSFLLMLLAREPVMRIDGHVERSSVLFFMETPRPSVTAASTTSSRPTQRAPTVVDQTNTPERAAIAPSPTQPPATIDWNTHAAQAAAAVVDKAIRQETRKCDPSDSPNSFLPRCKPRSHDFKWNPEESKVGFSGGLPYVRVGERCVIGLGFFGCGFGRKPPANGDLFEGMSDPERDRSSVPSPNP